jgi:hypothetical protein
MAATRTEATDLLVAAIDADPTVVAGLDFSFSLPAWWMDACRIGTVDELWDDDARLEAWLDACAPPFWGRPGKRRPALAWQDAYRLTELAAPRRPGSTFQIGGAGAVGTAALRGMPELARLRAAGYAIWPWDPWRPPVVAEVWPRLAIGTTVKSSAVGRAAWVEANAGALRPAVAAAVRDSDDALDAVAAALRLAADPLRTRPPIPGRQVALEGWIEGVPPPTEPE